MEIPTNLPTDNFYKFVTLLGIVIVALSIFAIADQHTDLRDQMREYQTEYRLSEPTTRQVQVTEFFANSAKDAAWWNNLIFGAFAGVGMSIALLGGLPWYFKHQRHLDRILKLERDKAEAEFAAKKPKG